jgi:hypothetical protein
VVKLIRSKGVSIFFVTQSPGDIPGSVMSQLGNKIEHGLHAYTPAEQKALNAAADAFRVNPDFDTKELMQNLGTGEAVVSVLDEKGAPTMAEHAFVLPPQSRMGAITDEERQAAVANSPMDAKYREMIDNVSAYELITGKGAQAAATESVTAPDGQVYGNTSGIPAAQPQEQPEISIDFEVGNDEEPVQTAPAKKKSKTKAKTDVQPEEEGGSAIGDVADNLLGKSGTRQVIRSTGGTIGREIGKTIGEAVLGKKGRTIGGNIGSSIGRNLFGTLSKR